MIASPEVFSSRRLRFWLPWISALVFVAGLVTFLIVYNVGGIRNTAHVDRPRPTNKPATVPKPLGRHAPLEKAAKLVAAKWIRDAVGRTNLAEAYRLSAPEVRQGMSLADWKTGDIPVVPFPIAESTAGISAINWSTKNDVSLLVTLVPKKGSGLKKAQDFFINLRAVGKGQERHWLVYYWAPRALPPIPDASAEH